MRMIRMILKQCFSNSSKSVGVRSHRIRYLWIFRSLIFRIKPGLSTTHAAKQFSLNKNDFVLCRTDLEMGKNKAASLCSHAALNCYKRALCDIPDITKKWERSGQTKVLHLESESEL
jgi:hypothetical protein